MKKFKIILLIIFCSILSGCSAEYNLIIDGDYIKEKVEIYADSKSETFVADLESSVCNGYQNQTKAYLPSLNKNNIAIKDYSKKYKDVEYYNIKYNDTIKSCNLNLDYNYYYQDFSKAVTTPQYIGEFSAKQINDSYVIRARDFNFFKIYTGVNNLKVTITTSFPVTENNADNISGNKYTWNITKSNYKNKNIVIKIKNDKTEETEEQKQPITTKEKIKENIVYIIGAIALIFVGIIAYVITSKKQNKY